MIGEKRRLYLKLLNLCPQGFGLCNICQHSAWWGDCCDAELECHCGIESIEEEADEVWQGNDCWAFRPEYSHEDIVDFIGICLQGKTPDMNKCKSTKSKGARQALRTRRVRNNQLAP
jgi:hypothetical protein